MSDQKILYVDDERANRVVFEQAFQRKFDIETVASGEQALDALAAGGFTVVVTDQRMPGISGHELLQCVRTRYPEVIRIVLTAYNDIDPILRAVNDGIVSRYIIKPWDRAELEQILRWATTEAILAREEATLQLHLHRTERRLSTKLIAGLLRGAAGDDVFATALDRIEQERPRGSTDPARAIRYATTMCQRHAGGTRTIIGSGVANLPMVELGAVELTLLLINLIDNAVAAGASGGRVSVDAHWVADRVEFVVSDDGVGMSDDVAARAGTPLFSTRPGHAGLGLAQCRMLLERVGGELRLESKPGAGTQARFWVPVMVQRHG